MRRSNYQKQKASKHQKSKKILIIISTIIFSLVLFLSSIFLKINKLGKYAYVNNKNGDVEVIIVDPQNDKYTKLLINSDFKVQSSMNFGEYKIGNLWILGDKSGIGGKLVSKTVAKNFLVPIYLWKNGKNTNLSFLQKVKSKIVENRLHEYSYSITSFKLPESILINLVDSEISEKEPKVKLEDLTGNVGTVEKVTQIIGIYGVRISAFSKGFDENLDCEVGGTMASLVKLTASVFECSTSLDNQEYDLVIRVGKAFVTRF